MTNKELKEYILKQKDFSLRLRENAVQGNMELAIAFHNGYLLALEGVLERLEL